MNHPRRELNRVYVNEIEEHKNDTLLQLNRLRTRDHHPNPNRLMRISNGKRTPKQSLSKSSNPFILKRITHNHNQNAIHKKKCLDRI